MRPAVGTERRRRARCTGQRSVEEARAWSDIGGDSAERDDANGNGRESRARGRDTRFVGETGTRVRPQPRCRYNWTTRNLHLTSSSSFALPFAATRSRHPGRFIRPLSLSNYLCVFISHFRSLPHSFYPSDLSSLRSYISPGLSHLSSPLFLLFPLHLLCRASPQARRYLFAPTYACVSL